MRERIYNWTICPNMDHCYQDDYGFGVGYLCDGYPERINVVCNFTLASGTPCYPKNMKACCENPNTTTCECLPS
jgi:hypothetical protein